MWINVRDIKLTTKPYNLLRRWMSTWNTPANLLRVPLSMEPSYRDLGDWPSAPGPATTDRLAGRCSNTPMPSYVRPIGRDYICNTLSPVSHSQGQSGTRCFHGSDPQWGQWVRRKSWWSSGRRLLRLHPTPCARAPRHRNVDGMGGLGSFRMHYLRQCIPHIMKVFLTRFDLKFDLGLQRVRLA
jgi:hypothetical protein